MLARIIASAAALAFTLGCPTLSDAGPLYLKEYVKNPIEPGSAQTPYPAEKTRIYDENPVGFPAWHLATYPYDPSKPNLSAPALYPAPYSINGDRADYWNLLNTENSVGWVFADPDEEEIFERRYLQFAMLAKHLGDDPAVGRVGNDFKLYYRVSTTGGQSFPNAQTFFPVIAMGYDVLHPFPNQFIGTDGATIPGTGGIKKSLAGDVLAGMTITHGPQDNVSGVTAAYVLRGKWNATGNDVAWQISQPGYLPTHWSTRGGEEPAVQELSAVSTGAVNCVMVARGSNEFYGGGHDGDVCNLHDKYRPGLAGHHWLFRSKDGCATWDGPPIRLSYNDGTPFYAPAANSALFRSPRDNRVYWVGSISASNSKGNWPRTKLVSGELDLQSSMPGIVKDSMIVLDEMYGIDTDQLELNNALLAMQPDKSAFLYLKRQDPGRAGSEKNSLSWYSLDVAEQGGLTLTATASDGSMHHLSWQADVPNVIEYHIRRRYRSGEPLSDLWREVGSEPGSSTGVTITGYEPWQEAEYELVAELSNGAAVTSNRVVARFAEWQGPRLSFTFPTEAQPGDPVPVGSVGITWTYAQPQALTGFRLYRRYLEGGSTQWTAMGDLSSSLRGVTLGGYSETDRFELRIDALTVNGTQLASNVVSVRFPDNCDELRKPY